MNPSNVILDTFTGYGVYLDDGILWESTDLYPLNLQTLYIDQVGVGTQTPNYSYIGEAVWVKDKFLTDQEVFATLKVIPQTSSTFMGLGIRAEIYPNWGSYDRRGSYFFYVASDHVWWERQDRRTPDYGDPFPPAVTVATAGHTPQVENKYWITAVGNTFTAYCNSGNGYLPILAMVDSTFTDVTTPTRVLLRASGTTRIDDFGAGNLPGKTSSITLPQAFNTASPTSSSGGGGGGAPGGKVAKATDPADDVYAYYSFAPVQKVYLSAYIYIPSEAMALFTPTWTGNITEIGQGDPTTFGEWQAIEPHFNGNEWGWVDYWSDSANDQITIIVDTWQQVEIMLELTGGNTFNTQFKVDGVAGPLYSQSSAGTPADLDFIAVGNIYTDATLDPNYFWYIDLVQYAFDNWVSDGGTVEKTFTFESGDFSEWTGTTAGITVEDAP